MWIRGGEVKSYLPAGFPAGGMVGVLFFDPLIYQLTK